MNQLIKLMIKTQKAVEESKKKFEENRVSELKEIDDSIELKSTPIEPVVEETEEEETEVDLEETEEPVVIVTPAPTNPETAIEKLRADEQAALAAVGIDLTDFKDTYGENQGNMPNDLYAIYKPIYDRYNELITLEAKKVNTPTVLNLRYPNKKSLFGTTENGKDVPAVKPGEKVIYVPIENRQGYKAIGIFVDRNGEYLEVGVLSQEELNNPPADKIELFEAFKQALQGQVTKFNIDNETGYLNVSNTSSLITLATGKVDNTSKLQYIYKQISEPFNWKNILTKFRKGFFTTTEGSMSKLESSKIRVFTNTEIADLKSKGVVFPLVAGRPYVMIENPVQEGGITAIPQFIELERKALNSKDHNFITQPIFDFIAKYEKFKYFCFHN